MRPLNAALAALAVAGLALPVAGCSHSSKAATVTVDIVGDPTRGGAYQPETLTIRAGTTVSWIERDTRLHTITANDNSFGSAFLGSDQRYTVRFNKPGTYAYRCTIHPLMTGTVVVR